jgi:hypothetical protein
MLPKYTIRISQDKIRQKVLEHHRRVEKAVISRMQFIGEHFIKEARENGTYNDITGNLRNSIGYVILNIGEIVAQGFFEEQGKEGAKKAKEFLEKKRGQFPTGIVLVACAGMDYAAYVEAKGKDVITGSTFEMKRRFRKAFDRLKKNTSIIPI